MLLFIVARSVHYRTRISLGKDRDGVMQNRTGFTLVEAMVLIGIFGILSAMAFPAVSKYVQTNRLDTSTSQMAADLNFARQMSITNGRVFRVTTENERYRVTDTTTGAIVREREFEGDVTLAMADSAIFFPWGMSEAKVFNLQSNAGNRTVTLLPTGIVEVN
ncbi:MAG: type II secretion system protein [bacterium]